MTAIPTALPFAIWRLPAQLNRPLVAATVFALLMMLPTLALLAVDPRTLQHEALCKCSMALS